MKRYIIISLVMFLAMGVCRCNGYEIRESMATMEIIPESNVVGATTSYTFRLKFHQGEAETRMVRMSIPRGYEIHDPADGSKVGDFVWRFSSPERLDHTGAIYSTTTPGKWRVYSDALKADTGYIEFDKESITITVPDLLPGDAYDMDVEDEGTIYLVTNPINPGDYTWSVEQTTSVNPKFTSVEGRQTITIIEKE